MSEVTVTSCADIILLADDDSHLLAYLQFKNLLPSTYKCPICDAFCEIIKKTHNNSAGYFAFRCQRTINGKRHSFHRSLNKNTFFDKAHINYEQILSIIFFWTILT